MASDGLPDLLYSHSPSTPGGPSSLRVVQSPGSGEKTLPTSPVLEQLELTLQV